MDLRIGHISLEMALCGDLTYPPLKELHAVCAQVGRGFLSDLVYSNAETSTNTVLAMRGLLDAPDELL